MPMLDFFLAIADGIHALYAGGMPDGLGLGAAGVGALGAGVAGGAAAGAGGTTGRGDRGFRYSGRGTTVYDRPSDDGTVVGQAPAGGRLIYDSVVRDASGNPTHYHVSLPGGPSGYVPAGNTYDTRPTVAPPARPSVVIEGGSGLARSSSAQTAGSRG
jgi:hypothetical protein